MGNEPLSEDDRSAQTGLVTELRKWVFLKNGPLKPVSFFWCPFKYQPFGVPYFEGTPYAKVNSGSQTRHSASFKDY